MVALDEKINEILDKLSSTKDSSDFLKSSVLDRISFRIFESEKQDSINGIENYIVSALNQLEHVLNRYTGFACSVDYWVDTHKSRELREHDKDNPERQLNGKRFKKINTTPQLMIDSDIFAKSMDAWKEYKLISDDTGIAPNMIIAPSKILNDNGIIQVKSDTYKFGQIELDALTVFRNLLNERVDKKHQLEMDTLVPIFNRRKTEQILKGIEQKYESEKRPYAIFMIDIDHFKKFNDTMGHSIGDEVLIETGKIISSYLRKGDLIGRYGGEEFFGAIVGLNSKNAYQRADGLRGYVQKEMQKRGYDLTISIGVYHNNGNTEKRSLEEKRICADKALYAAKKGLEGETVPTRNRIIMYSPEIDGKINGFDKK